MDFHSFRRGGASGNLPWMTVLRLMTLGLLLLAVRPVEAALSGSERKAFESASQVFQLKLWERAEREFAEFVRTYPKSEALPKAVLLQAQAHFEQREYAAVIELLQARLDTAGSMADQFFYWIGQAQSKSGDYGRAAETFGRLAREYPASPLRLEAAVNEAAAHARLGDWSTVLALLKRADGPFRLAAAQTGGGELVSRGFLLLAEAQLALGDFPGAEVSLNRVGKGLTADLEWQRRFLLSRVFAGSGRADRAAEESAGMIQAAQGAVQWGLLADSVVFRAELLEQLGRWSEALATWQINFTNAPVARQRQALTRAIALTIRQEQLPEATRILDLYLQANQYTNAPADVGWLTLGELHLKQSVTTPGTNAVGMAASNHLAAAEECFQRVVKDFPGSTYIGKAQLGLGWCHWVEGRMPESEAAFDAASKRLPPSADRAVALFKRADAQFVQTNYVAALESYRQVLQGLSSWPAADQALRTPASYQALRVSLALTNLDGAELALREILTTESTGPEAAGSVLLVAQAYAEAQRPEAAERLFAEFTTRFPDSRLRPEVDLLVARLHEEQGEWETAATDYDAWLGTYADHALRPRVEFQRALAAAGMAREAEALDRFTNFVARFATDALAPQAQWWVADHHFNRGDFATAELNYKLLFQTWPQSELAMTARLMAGRSALAIGSSKSAAAIEHFTSLTSDTNCPPDLWMQAMSAYGAALVRAPLPPEETNKLANLEAAMRVLRLMVQTHPTNSMAAPGWGEIGNCALQLGEYGAASNAYRTAVSFPGSPVAIRSQAKLGLAVVYEKMAQRAGDGEQANLLRAARDESLDVYLGKILTETETPDAFWRKKAGLEAARLSEALKDWPQALELYRDMQRQNLLPGEDFQKRIETIEKLQRATEPGAVGVRS